MICDLCGQSIINSNDKMHPKCIKKLFGVSYFPTINFAQSEIRMKAKKMVGRMSISGVQPKVSIILNKNTKTLQAADNVSGTQLCIYGNGQYRQKRGFIENRGQHKL